MAVSSPNATPAKAEDLFTRSLAESDPAIAEAIDSGAGLAKLHALIAFNAAHTQRPS